MSLKRLSIYVVTVAIFSGVVTLFTKSPYSLQVNKKYIKSRYKDQMPTDPRFNSIIKIYVDGGTCSAVVIDANYALTAAHCVTSTSGVMTRSNIQVLTSESLYATNANAAAVSLGRDVALLSGDFNSFFTSRVDFDGDYIRDFEKTNVVACGFPGGANMFCSYQKLVTNNHFKIKATGGIMQKGMSGGPIYNLISTGDLNEDSPVIGINSSVDESNNLFGPIMGIREEWDI